MNQEQRDKWERTRSKGMWRFVLLYGVLVWGGLMAVAISALRFLVWGEGFLDVLRLNAPVFLVAGLLFGLFCWLVAEYRYRKSAGAPTR